MPGTDKLSFTMRHEKGIRTLVWAVFIVLILLFIANHFVLFSLDFSAQPAPYVVDYSVDYFGMAIGLILFYSCIVEFDPKETNQIFYMGMIAICTAQLFVDTLSWALQGNADYIALNKVDNFWFYANGILLAVLYWYYVRGLTHYKEKFYKSAGIILHVIAIISVIALLFNLKFGFYYTVDETGTYARAALSTYLLCMIGPALIFFSVFLFVLTSDIPTRQKTALSIYALLPALFVVVQNASFGLSLEYSALMIALFVVHCYVHMQKVYELKNEELLMLEQKSRLLSSQMQPQFLNNGLLEIRSLISNDPDKAERAIDCVSGYLRGSIDMLSEEGLIPIQEELQFILDYIGIEKIHFGDNLTFEMKADAVNFKVPPFSIQPLVENAVEYGVRGREDGKGTVKLYTYEDADDYVISICDDGVGFGVKSEFAHEHRHVDTKTVRERLKLLCRGSLEVASQAGEGTMITIRLPKQDDRKKK